MKLNTNYKISDITLSSLHSAIERYGFSGALDIAISKSIDDIRGGHGVVLIAEYLSWSYHLSSCTASCTVPELRSLYTDAASFYRKLSHHMYWEARRLNLIDVNPNFIQAVK